MSTKLFVDIGTRNFAYCIKKDNEIIELKNINLEENNVAYTRGVFDFLESKAFDEVFCEQQIANQTKMIILQNMIYMYCMVKGIPFQLIHPKTKSKLINPEKEKSNHSKNKKMAIDYCKKHYSQIYDLHIANNSKQDDLCDVLIYSMM